MKGRDCRRLHTAIGFAIGELERPRHGDLSRSLDLLRYRLIRELRDAEDQVAATMSRMGQCPESHDRHRFIDGVCDYCGAPQRKVPT